MKDMLRKEILVGVIAAIVTTIFFEPIIKWFWGIITFLGVRSYSGFLDSIYRNAALGHRNHIDVMIFFFIIGTGMVVPISLGRSTGNFVFRIGKKIEALNPKFQQAIEISLILGVIIPGFSLIISTFSDLQLNTSFEQRLTVLAPILSDQEYKELRATWASMDSRDDFNYINSEMENFAKEGNIKLPELLLP